MAKVGEKRSAEEKANEGDDSKVATPPSSGFNLLFKPSPLANVASSLTTYNAVTSKSSSHESNPQQQQPFKKLPKFNFSEVTQSVKSPVKFTSPTIMQAQTPRSLDNGRGLLAKRHHNGSNDEDTPTKKSNLFIECLSQSSTAEEKGSVEQGGKGFLFGEQLSSRAVMTTQSSSAGELTTASTTDDSATTTPTASEECTEQQKVVGSSIGGGVMSHSSPTSVILPAVETVTGEEGERHVTQISCSLFAFDSTTRSWKERGRGELRLNDTPKSEGAYQSRLIMRASGSRRVCLNTHLWATMVCEKANNRSIRITAQEPEGGFGVYLIKGAPKDVSNLFTAVGRRLDALKIASSRDKKQASGCGSSERQSTPPPTVPEGFVEDDSIFGDRPPRYSSSPSPDSSPERQTERFEQPLASSYSVSAPSSVYSTPSLIVDSTSSSTSSFKEPSSVMSETSPAGTIPAGTTSTTSTTGTTGGGGSTPPDSSDQPSSTVNTD